MQQRLVRTAWRGTCADRGLSFCKSVLALPDRRPPIRGNSGNWIRHGREEIIRNHRSRLLELACAEPSGDRSISKMKSVGLIGCAGKRTKVYRPYPFGSHSKRLE